MWNFERSILDFHIDVSCNLLPLSHHHGCVSSDIPDVVSGKIGVGAKNLTQNNETYARARSLMKGHETLQIRSSTVSKLLLTRHVRLKITQTPTSAFYA